MKNNKAAEGDQLPNELLKYGGETLVRALHWVITKIWEEEVLPEEWMEGIVCPIYKKGDKLDCGNYSAITLLSAAYKILSQILCRRLSPIAREFVGQYQAGFMGERATTDQMFAIRQVLQKCREYNVPTHHLFIDFKSAYDTIDREQLADYARIRIPGLTDTIDQGNDGSSDVRSSSIRDTLESLRISQRVTAR